MSDRLVMTSPLVTLNNDSSAIINIINFEGALNKRTIPTRLFKFWKYKIETYKLLKERTYAFIEYNLSISHDSSLSLFHPPVLESENAAQILGDILVDGKKGFVELHTPCIVILSQEMFLL